jgi:hypothetical protein
MAGDVTKWYQNMVSNIDPAWAMLVEVKEKVSKELLSN